MKRQVRTDLACLGGHGSESLVAQSLEWQGFDVELPEIWNQPTFDLFVGCSPHQVKCVENPAY